MVNIGACWTEAQLIFDCPDNILPQKTGSQILNSRMTPSSKKS